jgi:integrase
MKIDAKTVTRLALPEGKADAIYFDDVLPGFGLRLRQSGDQLRRSWIVQYRHAGATRRLLLGSADVLGVEAARGLAKKALGKVAHGEDPQEQKATRRERDALTFRSLVDDYLAWKQSTNIRPRTLVEIKRYLTGPYFSALHSMPIDKITRRDVASRVLAIGKDNGTVTATLARSALSACFVWAMKTGLCEVNPVAKTLVPEGAKPRDRVLDDNELAAVWRAAGDDDFGKIVRLLILTGQRRSEVGGMAWSELERGTWTIPGQRTKNGRAHTLPLSGLALSIIDAVPQRVGRDQLFGDRGLSGFTMWDWSKSRLDERLGDKVKPWTLHDLRRSAATRICDLGVMPHVVEQILNHHSGHRSGIVGVYNRSAYEQPVKAALGMWADHIRAITEGGARRARKVLAFAAAAS